MARYTKEIMANRRAQAYVIAAKVDNAYDRQLVTTQCAVQDIFWSQKDVEEIRRLELSCKFLCVGTEPLEKAAEFIVLMKYPWKVHIPLRASPSHQKPC